MTIDSALELVPANIPGVFSKMRRPGTSTDASSIHEMFDHTVLARLLETDTAAARVFREKILSRRWHPISPVLNPQTEITHRLRAPAGAPADPVTGTNWAGAMINGTWSAAFGIWRVPEVHIPRTPPRPGGGWLSSSWVGIDNRRSSNDVLQAGVSQKIVPFGQATYNAWYEWVPSGPVNIDNMPVSPGDEFFCAVYHLNPQQGEIIFGNVDQGQYVTFVLTPPKDAVFLGNVAEWIMETPTVRGVGLASLPKFTPVIFSTAFAQGDATVQPTANDTVNIVRSGQTLTSVTILSTGLEIDYGAKLKGEPIAAVVPGTQILQLFYRATDDSVWSRWRTPDGNWSDEQAIGGKLSGDPIAASIPGDPILRLFYRGMDKSVQSRSRTPDGWSGEQHLGGVLNGDPIAAMVPGTDSLQLFYRGADNGVWSRWRNPDGSWSDEQGIGGVLNGDPIAAVVPGTDILQLFYRGADNSVWSRWRDNEDGWSDEQHIGGVLNGDPIAAGIPGTDILQLFYRGADNSIWSRWRNPNGIWSDEQHIGGVLNGDPIAAVIPGTDILQLFYRGADNSVWSRWRNSDGSWSGEQHIGGVLNGDPIAAVVPGRAILQLFYRGTDNSVWSRLRNADGSWSNEQHIGE